MDSLGAWSGPIDETFIIKLNEIGDPVQVLPRFATSGQRVRAYNVPAGGITCLVEHAGSKGLCSEETAETCTVNSLEKPVLDINIQENGLYWFEIGRDINYIPTVKLGDLKITMSQPAVSGDILDFGTLEDSDFVSDGKYVSLSTDKDIHNDLGNKYRGMFFTLYRKENCALTEIIGLKRFESQSNSLRNFYGSLKPNDCSIGEDCEYVGEIIGFDGHTVGGTLFTFTYHRPFGNLSVDVSNIDLGILNPNDEVSGSFVLTALENGLSGITAGTEADGLSLSLGKNSLSAGESTTLSFDVEVPSNAEDGTYTSYINVSGATGTKTEYVLLTVSYTVYVPTPSIIISPASHNFGKLDPGQSADTSFTIRNVGDGAAVSLKAISVGDFVGTVDTATLLPNESAELVAAVNVPSNAETGTYSEVMEITWGDESESINVSLRYNVYIILPPKALLLPDSWKIGSVPPGAVLSQEFTPGLSQGEQDNITINVSISDPAVNAEFTAPQAEGEYEETITFVFKDQDAVFDTIEAPVTFKVVEDIQTLLDDGTGRLGKTVADLDNLQAQVSQVGKLYKKVAENITIANMHLANAEQKLIEAQAALNTGDKELAKQLISEANAELIKVDNIVMLLDNFLKAPKESFFQKFKFILIIIVAGSAAAAGLFALREGLMPAELVKTVGLGSFVKKKDIAPRPRFTPVSPPKVSHAAPAKAPTPENTKSQWTQAETAKWQDYYKKHPQAAEKWRKYYEQHPDYAKH